MTARAALTMLLLDGEIISIKNAFPWLGISHLANEIQAIEKKFGVKISKTGHSDYSKYGLRRTYTNYRLNQVNYNQVAIEKMKKYLQKFGITYDDLNTQPRQQLKINFQNLDSEC